MAVVNLTPEEMEAALGDKLKALRLSRNLDQQTLAERAGQLREENRVVVRRHIASVAAHESAQRHIRRGFDFVGGDEAEARLPPRFRRAEIAHLEHGMADPADMGRTCFEPDRPALARRRGFDPDTPPHLRKVTETV